MARIGGVTYIKCVFVRHYLLAENIKYNADALCTLDTHNDQGVFNKLIVIQAASILEAALGEIISRAQDPNDKKIPEFTESERTQIRDQEINTFEKIIDAHKRCETLDSLGSDIYQDLHEIRKARNKIHFKVPDRQSIQKCEEFFISPIITKAIDVNHKVLKYLEGNFSRPQEGQVIIFLVPTL